jgi:hypothetical protein
MSPLSLAINALFPVVWADPQTLHIGFDPPRVILREVEDDLLLLLHHLTSGVSESGLRMFAESSGVHDKRLSALLEQLTPVLASSPPEPTQEILVDATPALADRASHALANIGITGLRPTGGDTPTDSHTEVLVLAHFVPDPQQFIRWLRRDQPHTPVIFTDQAITVGPRIVPGETACLHCELTHDQALPWSSVPIVSQLWGKTAPTATPTNITRATWQAIALLEDTSPRYQLRISPWSGTQERREVRPKPGCGCRELS